MQRFRGLSVPDTVAEICRPEWTAVLVYDAQVGILPAVRDADALVTNIRRVLDAARSAGVPVYYTRHTSVPTTHMGVAALRTAMAWQRVQHVDDVVSAFPPAAEHTQIDDRLAPTADEPVFDKLGMSAFVGTPLESVLHDRGAGSLLLVGAVLEIGIEPSARHAADLGLLPVVVEDACGVVEPDAAQRSLDSLDYSLMSYRCTTAQAESWLASSSQP
jgi:biuret amidohydrolase